MFVNSYHSSMLYLSFIKLETRCPKLTLVNGEVFGQKNGEIGRKPTFYCKTGFKKVWIPSNTLDFRECLANGSWSGPPPVCELVRCPEPRPPAHGFVIGAASGYLYNRCAANSTYALSLHLVYMLMI